MTPICAPAESVQNTRGLLLASTIHRALDNGLLELRDGRVYITEKGLERNDPVLMQYHGKGRYPDGGPIRIVDLEDPSTWAKPEPAAGTEMVAEADAKPILFTQPLEDMSMAAVLGRLSPKNQPTPRMGWIS